MIIHVKHQVKVLLLAERCSGFMPGFHILTDDASVPSCHPWDAQWALFPLGVCGLIAVLAVLRGEMRIEVEEGIRLRCKQDVLPIIEVIGEEDLGPKQFALATYTFFMGTKSQDNLLLASSPLL